MSGEIVFDTAALRRSADEMDAAAEHVYTTGQDLLSRVSDLSVLGTNDTLGALAQLLYGAVLARVSETLESISTEFGNHAVALSQSAADYDEFETAAAEAGTGMVD